MGGEASNETPADPEAVPSNIVSKFNNKAPAAPVVPETKPVKVQIPSIFSRKYSYNTGAVGLSLTDSLSNVMP